MDLILIVITVGALSFVAWLARKVGEDAAARQYQGELASLRAKVRRLQRDLDNAHEETAMVRRAVRGDAA
jgi:hypothetical protein